MLEGLAIFLALGIAYCGLLLLALCQRVQIARQGVSHARKRSWRMIIACARLGIAFNVMTLPTREGWAALYFVEALAPLSWAVALTLRKPRKFLAVLIDLGRR